MKIYYLKCKCAKALLLGLLSLLVLQCKQQLDVPDTYSYTSRFDSTKSSVNYASQTFRHVLIQELKSNIGKLSVENTALTAEKVKAELTKYYEFDSTNNGTDNLTITSEPSPKQKMFNDLKSDAPNLKKKIAGNDKIGQHKDWSKDFIGWKDGSKVISPDDLIQLWFTELADLMASRSTSPENEPGTKTGVENPITKPYVSAEGLDYQQLIQKFLGVAIAWSQGADDYLDNDTPEKGLKADNSEAVEGKLYTELEHNWDEAFGYFGSAHDYGSYTDEDIKKKVTKDTDEDSTINLLSEYNFGHSTNSAKRDFGVAKLSPTDFTRDIFLAFRQGRSLISSNEGDLNETDLAKLIEYRNTILQVWEKTIASTVVHYINEVLQDMVKFGDETYGFLDHAKHWSELKGFSLGLQFNRLSPLTKENFVKLHEHIGQKPVLSTGSDLEKSNYKKALLEARNILKTAYQFNDKNIGDEKGAGGW